MFKDATIVALAWPDTKVIHEGKWYDVPMRWLGVLKNNYYSAGHAAFLLINHNNNDVHYFDFGRYQTPLKFGRVRSAATDPDIEVKIKAQIEKGELLNIEELLLERFFNKACHGEGRLTASIVKDINFDNAYNKATNMQNLDAICYGPFTYNGSNCSRFVTQVVLASCNNYITKLMIRVPYTVTATPRSNTKILNDLSYYYEVINGEIQKRKSKFYFFKKWFNGQVSNKLDANIQLGNNKNLNTNTKRLSSGLIGTMVAPDLPLCIPRNSKWVSGQGLGSWFNIETIGDNKYRITRYTPQGTIDCKRIFELIDNGFTFKVDHPYQFVHISHCQLCRIQQNDQLFIFKYEK